MNYNSLEEKYFKFYQEIQYKGQNSYVSNFYHFRMEKGLDNIFFKNVLEVGAGQGQHFNFVNHKFEFYKITDLILPNLIPSVANKVNQINKNDIKVSIESQNVEQLSYESGTFDRTIVTCVLHHLKNPLAALEEIRRVTRDKGLITIYLPSDPGFLYRIAQTLVSNNSFKNHFSKKELKLLRALEHRNHVSSLLEMIYKIFESDELTFRTFPKLNFGWNTSLFQVVTIKIRK
jgi:phosphatidylethanolamine/phosphatidyl-N-methylethanolamine N-methyltransferase